jgi:hypothetical protein
MKRTLRLVVAALAFLLISVGSVAAAPYDENRPKVGEEAREFEIQGFKLSDLKGKKNLVMIFYRGHF